MDGRVEITTGDITKIDADAIVNAANESLLGGGGVDGAIHRAAGPELLEECRKLGGCPTGHARVTGGYSLPARHVIHTVGPVWQGGDQGEDALLRSVYTTSLAAAQGIGAKRVAFPAISTGVYGFPKELAADIAIAAGTDWISAESLPETIIFVCFDKETAALYISRLSGAGQSGT